MMYVNADVGCRLQFTAGYSVLLLLRTKTAFYSTIDTVRMTAAEWTRNPRLL